MGKEKPHPLSQCRVLFEQALDQPHEGARTSVRRQYRLRVLAAHGVIRTVLKCLGEEPSVHVKQRW